MKLDVVVPTYNRSALLRLTVESLFKAVVPAGLQITILVVDNNSADDTEQTVRSLQIDAPITLRYIRETGQGSSRARNAGIAAGTGELIGFVDDDEEIDVSWYEVLAREFAVPDLQFIGGPYLANWAAPPPDWLPPGYHAAIGHIPPKPRGKFGSEVDAVLMGGNAVLRRSVFDLIGTYSPTLGRSGKGLLSEEDAEFTRRLEAASIHGVYVPDLIIHHYIPVERLTRKYHRRWAFWRAVSHGVVARNSHEAVEHFCGLPRYRIGRAVSGLFTMYPHRRNGRTAEAFANELAIWDLVGFVYGRFFLRVESMYKSSVLSKQAKIT